MYPIYRAALLIGLVAQAQTASQPFNYDEAKIPPYTLPDPLKLDDGRTVTTAVQWTRQRRPELLKAFAAEIYGVTPAGHVSLQPTALDVDRTALGGTAIRRQVTLVLSRNGLRRELHLLVYLPARVNGPVPVFLGLNFSGNHTVSADPGIRLHAVWAHPKDKWLTVITPLQHIVPDASERGQAASQWQLEKIIAAGYGLATVYDGDVEPDSPEGLAQGVRPLFYRPGQTAPDADQWGTIGAWAWGLSRITDYLQTVPGIDPHGIVVFGHSRLGKTALWASAQDTRFAMVIANESGKGGAALAKRIYGQTTEDLNIHYPHWFSGSNKQYGNRESALTVDNHELIALSAPRSVYIGTALDDRGSDPHGQFLAEQGAEPVYALFHKTGLEVATMPPPETPIQHDLGFHERLGSHGVVAYDWAQYLRFADLHLKPKTP